MINYQLHIQQLVLKYLYNLICTFCIILTFLTVKMTETRTEEEGNDRESDVPLPPDGGWGWVVTLSSFIVSFLVDGVCFTFGLFLPSFLDHFGGSKGKTALLGSVMNGMYLSFGKDPFLFNYFSSLKVNCTFTLKVRSSNNLVQYYIYSYCLTPL